MIKRERERESGFPRTTTGREEGLVRESACKHDIKLYQLDPRAEATHLIIRVITIRQYAAHHD